ncbi:CARDB domain-containing protein [Streptomyces lavendulae]|uniref:CARDB domain-containing protein n=1 Tax=Streptomyces lavendulae TaxID=1914 RepID=UPI003712C5A1
MAADVSAELDRMQATMAKVGTAPPSGKPLTIHVNATMPSSPGTVTLRARVTHQGAGDALAEAATSTRVTAPDLTTTTESRPATPAAGKDVTYVVTVTNSGTATSAADATLSLVLGAGFTVAPGALNNNGTYDSGSYTAAWTLSPLPARARQAYTVTGHLAPGAAIPTPRAAIKTTP